MREIRIFLAEILIDWTLSVFPEGRERIAFATALIYYFEVITPEAVAAVRARRIIP